MMNRFQSSNTVHFCISCLQPHLFCKFLLILPVCCSALHETTTSLGIYRKVILCLLTVGIYSGSAAAQDLTLSPSETVINDTEVITLSPLVIPPQGAIALPSAEELSSAADLYITEGAKALDNLFILNPDELDAETAPSCGIHIPLSIRATAYALSSEDPERYSELPEKIDTILSDSARQQRFPSISTQLGDDWSLTIPPQNNPDLAISTSPTLESLEALRRDIIDLNTGSDRDSGFLGDNSDTDRTSNLDESSSELLFSHTQAQQKEDITIGRPPVRLFVQVRDNAPTLFDGLPNLFAESGPRNSHSRMCNQIIPNAGLDPNTEFAYRIKDNFYIYYNFCGERAITEQKTIRDASGNIIAGENRDFAYKYPDGSVALIRRCTLYSLDCAPTHVQMIAADLVYARDSFRAVGFKVPVGGMAAVAPEIPVHITQNGERSTAHLGRIWLHEPLSEGGWKMRWLAFHEYFHLVQFAHRADRSFVQGVHNWSARPRDVVSWTAPFSGLVMSSFFWGNLESMAAWAADVLMTSYPTYDGPNNAWNDARGYPFFSSYADLVYGYMAERFSKSASPGFCPGCDAMVEFVWDFLDPDNEAQRGDAYKWAKTEYLEKYLASKNLSLARFAEDFHKDLIYSLYKESPEGGQPFRFINRHSPTTTAWDWPPKLTQVPNELKTKDDIGICDSNAADLRRSNARPQPSNPHSGPIISYQCTFRMAPAGALHLRLPIFNPDIPALISVAAQALLPDGSPAPAAPQIILVPTAAGIKAGTDYNEMTALTQPIYSSPSSNHLLSSKKALSTAGLSAYQADGLNYVFMIVRYPDFWQRFRAIAQDDPNVTTPQASYIEDPINMQLEIKAVW